MKRITFLIFFTCITYYSLYAQGKEANNWAFSFFAGITFNNGISPVSIDNIKLSNGIGSASISDKNNGSLLFYSNGESVWNKNNTIMPNGDNVGTIAEGIMIVPDPGDENLFFLFNFRYNEYYQSQLELRYTKIDMRLDNGLGDVIQEEKNILLRIHCSGHLTAVRHNDGESVWLIAHDDESNEYLSYLITKDSLNSIPKISNVGHTFDMGFGNIKVSPNGKKLAAALYMSLNATFLEILDFDNISGLVSDSNIVHNDWPAYGVEFSPDNSKLYASEGILHFTQYDLSSNEPDLILSSAYQLNSGAYSPGFVQLGPDGKLYTRGTDNMYLTVINNPNEIGSACNFINNELYLNGAYVGEGLPTFIQSYLNDPEFTTSTRCTRLPTQFNIVNTNGIDSVLWTFHDPGNAPYDTSTLFSPSFTFSAADTFYVELTAYSGYLHRTVIDTVIIFETPTPQFPNDTAYCAGETIDLLLDAGPGQSYSWNNAWPATNQTYQVTNPGTYTVRVIDHGCMGNDTINVLRYAEPVVDTNNVFQQNAGCGIADGSITGITVSGGENVSYEWQNSMGVVVSTDLDLVDMPADFYILLVKYGENCSVEAYTGEIQNALAPLITKIDPLPDHCNQSIGGLHVSANSSTGSLLLYSINGSDFFSSDLFTDLPADFYTITVKDENNCIQTDTITLQNIPGPIVTDSIATNENGYASDGTITINAQGTGLIYTLDNGSPQNNGLFTGLSAGPHEVKITDQYGCERIVNMMVERTEGTILSAYAGGDYKCKKELAHSLLTADNFINVKEYKAVLKYNNSRLNCTSYSPGDEFPGLDVFTSPGRVEVQWQNNEPKTVTGTVQLVDLIFETIDWGSADIKWDTAYCEFKDDHGNVIQPSLEPGVIIINNPPELHNLSLKTAFCEGERAELIASSSGGIGPFTYTWETPVKVTTADATILIDSILLNQSGTYKLKIIDSNNCFDILNIPVTVFALPSANFPAVNDTIFYGQQTTLAATQGYASYQWSTGDTTYYTFVDKEGEYSVLMQSAEGCQKLETVVMSDTYVDIRVPNAFTPNGDGLNDTFKPVVNLERIKQYHLAIYNKWGQLLFESSNPLKGWDGQNFGNGVYIWVIEFKNRIGKAGKVKGSVVVLE